MSKRIVSLLTIFLAVLSTFALFNTSPVHAAQSPGKYFDNTLIIVMENEGVCNIMGSALGCSPDLAPYDTSLAQNWTLGTHYTSVDNTTSNSFSLKNYFALLSGQTWGCTYDTDTTCLGKAYNSTNSNLVDRLPASVTWKAYMENMTSNCQTTGNYPSTYAPRHDPFALFGDIVTNSTRCNQVVPAGTNGSLDSTVLNDLNSASAPNLMWLTPNLCDDMHDICNGPNNQTSTQKACTSALSNQTICIPQGDKYLKNLVPSILSSYTFTHNRAALFISYDEGNGYCTNGNSNDDCVYAMWAGRVTKKAFSAATQYIPGHYSWLKTIESNWGFSCLAHDCSASDLGEFFIPTFSLSASPASVSILCTILGCDPGHTVSSNLTIIGLNGFTGLVNLTYVAPANSVSGVYVTGPSTATVPVGGGPVLETLTAHGSGTTSGTFVWTINGHSYAPYAVFSISTTLTVQYTWCAHCTLPGH